MGLGRPFRSLDAADARGALKLARFSDAEGTLVVALRATGELVSWRADDGAVAAFRVEHAHPGWILDATSQPTRDGVQLLTAGADGALRSWTANGHPGRMVVEHAHNASIRNVCLLPFNDDYRVATAGGDQTLRSWHTDGRLGELDKRCVHETWIWGLVAVTTASHPPFLVTVAEDRTIRSWFFDGSAGPLQVRNAHDGRIHCVAAIQDDEDAVVVTGGTDGALRFWSADGHLVEDIPAAHGGSIRAIAPHAQGVVTAGADGAIIAWSRRERPSGGDVSRASRVIGSIPVAERPFRNAHAGVVSALVAVETADAQLVVSAGGDGAVRLWRTDEVVPREIATLQSPALVRHLIALDESHLVMVGADDSVSLVAIEHPAEEEAASSDTRQWTVTLADPTTTPIPRGLLGELRSAGVGSVGAVRTDAGMKAIVADLPTIVTVHRDNVALWFASGRRVDLGLKLPTAAGRVLVEAMNMTPEPVVVVAFDDGRIETWLPHGDEGPFSVEAHRGAVRGLTTLWLNGSAVLVSVGDDSYIRSWDITSGQLRYEFKTYEAGASVAALGSDGFAFGNVVGGIVFATDAMM